MSASASPAVPSCAICACSDVELEAELHPVPCGHLYCAECLERMARLSVKDRALIPLRCCRKELPVECVKLAFSHTGAGDYEFYETHLANRVKNWMKSDLLSDKEYTKSVLAVGGKQCPQCGIGVERDFGCVHMKCIDGHEFCFTCLAKWHTCKCQLIPEQEIRAALNE